MDNSIKRHLKGFMQKSFAFKKTCQDLQKSQYFSKEELVSLQNKKLQRIIHHSYKNVSYYNDLFRELKLTPEDIATKEDLRKLPFLDKRVVKDNFDKLNTKSNLKFLYYKAYTSGTTGTPGKFFRDYRSINFENAALRRHYQNVGDMGHKKVTLRGDIIVPLTCNTPPFWKYNPIDNELIMSSYHLSSKTIKAYIEKLSEFNPQILHAYPSVAYLLAKYCGKLSKELNFKAIFTSSETLSTEQRKFIEKVFNCPIYDWYGQVERVAAIGQCEKGTYHIIEDYSIVETIDTNSGLEIVGTHLHNYIMPLIRYRTEDIVEIKPHKCSCNRNYREINKIYGREVDYLLTSNGPQFVAFDHILRNIDNIIEAQIVQEKIGEIIINITTNGNFSQRDKDQLIKNTLDRTSGGMKVIVNVLDSIPRGPNGKFISVINKLIDGNTVLN